jgi:hypothetical protein
MYFSLLENLRAGGKSRKENLESRRTEVRRQTSEVRSRKSEAGNADCELRIWDLASRRKSEPDWHSTRAGCAPLAEARLRDEAAEVFHNSGVQRNSAMTRPNIFIDYLANHAQRAEELAQILLVGMAIDLRAPG